MKSDEKYSHISNILFLFLVTALFISVYTFILQKNYSNTTLEAAVERDIECSDAIHKLLSNKFTREDYTKINTAEDMQTERYKNIQTNLNELRSLNSTRYLYTAKKGADGRLIYLVDGLDLGAKDFAYPGTYIEKEMVPYIEKALAGETVYSQEIVDTTWGHIFTACYPVKANDGSGDIIGALCIEMDMESSYKVLKASNESSVRVAGIGFLIAVLLFAIAYLSMQKQKQKEKEQNNVLEKTAEAAKAANKAKSTFLFNMSHDIRTPMNAIIGYAELTEKHLEEPKKIGEYVKNIRICGNKMLSIIDNVLELARIENGKTMIEESAVKTGDNFDSCVIMFAASLKEKNQKLVVTKDIRYPYIYMDAAHVSEIILNIVSNAIKYTGDGGEITCHLSQRPDERDGWCVNELTIADNGIGMSEEFQTHIFESFSRERSSTVSGVEGTGLGMGIVKKLIDLMGGTIKINSKVGVGTTVFISFPTRIADETAMKPVRIEDWTRYESLAGKKILLAEDNELNAEIAVELLQGDGLIVDRVVNGVDCVNKIKNEKAQEYGLILMDIQMPVMDGYEATKKIRKLEDHEKAQIPIIAMTANAFAEDRDKALAVGMNEHVSKPIDMNKLLPVLQKYL